MGKRKAETFKRIEDLDGDFIDVDVWYGDARVTIATFCVLLAPDQVDALIEALQAAKESICNS